MDEAQASSSVFGRRVAHGLLGTSVAAGLINQRGVTRGTLVALLGVEWRFAAPLYPGTEVRVELEVSSRRETRHSDRGVVVFGARLMTDPGEALQEGELRVLVRRR